MNRLVIISIALTGFLVGCGPRYRVGSVDSYGNADRETVTEVVRQRDPDGHLLFLIAWTAKNGGGKTSFSDRNLLTSIHGHKVYPSLDHRAVYALQADGTLQKIPLSDEELATLFREMEDINFHTSHNDIWQKMVTPHLIRVEATNDN
jgi:hypothetical protein